MTDTTTNSTGNILRLIPRLLAGLPLLGFGIMHFIKPDHFHDILVASGFPMVGISMYAAPLAEVLGGVLLLLGLCARLGGILGVATMLPAIYATVALSKMTVENLPGGLTEVPSVPPLPLPVIVTLASIVILFLGAGKWSVGCNCKSC
jgi:uncharacterized membrane protein YphA (DoxX/SURF4 family)